MKKNNLLELIKRDVSSKTPDIVHKIDLDRITIEPKKQPRFKRAFRLSGAFASVLAVLVLLIMFWPTTGTPDDNTPPTTVLKEKDNAIGFSAMSSVLALDSLSITNGSTNPLAMNNPLLMDAQTQYNLLEDIDILEDYYPIINTFLNQQDGFDVEVELSDNPDYEYKMLIHFADITGTDKVYEFHYNETIDGEDEDEQESTIDGIMLIGTQTYTVTGERAISDEEESLEMRASLDEENYVIIEYETETETESQAIEYYYEVYQNDTLLRSMEIEFEDNNEETEMAMVFIENNIIREFAFEIEMDDDIRIIEIEFVITENDEVIDEGEIEGIIRYDETLEKYIITYRVQRDDEDDEIYEDDYDDDDNDDDEEDEEDNDEEDNDEEDEEDDDEDEL